MTRLLPVSWKPSMRRFLPGRPAEVDVPSLPRWFAAACLVVIVVRSLIHMFAADGGAHSIATIDTSVAGGSNIIAIFGQWGAIQLLLALLLWTLLIRYRGLTALVLLTLLLEPFLRALAGHLKPIDTVGTAPGAALNWVVVPVLAVLLWMALCPATASDAVEVG